MLENLKRLLVSRFNNYDQKTRHSVYPGHLVSKNVSNGALACRKYFYFIQLLDVCLFHYLVGHFMLRSVSALISTFH